MKAVTKTLLNSFGIVALAAVAFYALEASAQQDATIETIFQGVLKAGEQLAAEFKVNPELGRAWVQVDRISGGEDYSPGPEPVFPLVMESMERSIAGLSYDNASGQVIYKSGATQVVCAEQSRFLWSTSLKETGNCPLRVSVQALAVDDGFNVHQERSGQIALGLRTSGDSAVSTR